MSIRGIDTQIMITRLPDNARESSYVQKRPEIAQDLLAAQQIINDAQEQSKVAKTSESEMEGVRADVDEDGNGAYEGGSRSKKDRKEDKTDPDMIVASNSNRIDIKI